MEPWTVLKLGKEYIKTVCCHPSIYHEKRWAGDSQVGIKIVRRNINNLRYADGTTLMTELVLLNCGVGEES